MRHQESVQKMALHLGVLAIFTLGTAGCAFTSLGGSQSTTPTTQARTTMQGKVFGGQQPVAGAAIQLYVAGSAGYGTASTPLLASPVSTDQNGGFNISGDYVCPSADSEVYLVGTGGNPGSGTPNQQLSLMAALGACGDLSSSTYISVNELTTVAAVWALAPFMSNFSSIGTSATNVTGLANAFDTAAELVSSATGTAPGSAAAGAVVPVAELNTLADILASCVNSAGGVAGDSSVCGQLFSASTPNGRTAPGDTIAAALNIATNPSLNVGTLLSLTSAQPPFQPTLPSASDFTVSIRYSPAGVSSPASSAVDASGNLWVANSTGGILQIDPGGIPIANYVNSNILAPQAVALDANGNAWVANGGNNSLAIISNGVVTTPPVSGLSGPSSLAIDPQGTVWVTNSTSNSVTGVKTSGTTVTSVVPFSGAGISSPVGVAINPH